MYMNVETVPQIQPAVCSFLGFGHPEAKWFLRVQTPEDFYDTILISDIAFKEMAKQVGFVEKTQAMKDAESLREELNATRDNLDSIRASLDNLATVLGVAEDLRTRLNSIERSLKTAIKVGGTDRESDAGASEDSK